MLKLINRYRNTRRALAKANAVIAELQRDLSRYRDLSTLGDGPSDMDLIDAYERYEHAKHLLNNA